MILKVANPKAAYDYLNKAHLLEKVPGFDEEKWRNGLEDQEELENMQKTAGYELHAIELPCPLDEIKVSFEREGACYIAEASVTARNKKVFRGLSARLNADIRDLEMSFFQTTASGSGHVLKNKLPLFSIIESSDLSRTISMGLYGCVPKKFESFEEFQQDLVGFEKIINIYVANCLALKPLSSRVLDDITLYFSYSR